MNAEVGRYLVEEAGWVIRHDLLQDTPVSPRCVDRDAAASLQVQLIHVLTDVVQENSLPTPDSALELGQWRPCRPH